MTFNENDTTAIMSEEREKEKTGFWGLFRGGTLSRKLTKSVGYSYMRLLR